MRITEISFNGGIHIFAADVGGQRYTIQTPNDKQWVEEHAQELLLGGDADAPTQLDMIEAQVMYTAMMTDTLLEE